jgi:HPt (histidine-containing phosphotransfer) domain-containing protein
VKKSDTTFFTKQGITKTLLDQTLISELRAMPPVGGATMLKELISLFLEQAPGRIAQINQFLGDPQKMAFHAHALKSMSLNLGANRIAQLCQKLEEMAHSGNEDSINRLAQELDSTFRQTQAELISLQDAEK